MPISAVQIRETGDVADANGTWDCVVQSPMGEQAFTFTVATAGDRFSGRTAGKLGSLDIDDGMVEGDRLAWSMRVPKPLPMTLRCEARIEGDALAGEVKAGPFGTFPVTGTRAA